MTLLISNIKSKLTKKSSPKSSTASPAVIGPESIMSQKAHGTSSTPVQENLRWNCDNAKADKICNFNRKYAEHSWYYRTRSDFMKEANSIKEMTFYDSNTGIPLFIVGGDNKRTLKEFLRESAFHGWPSFRDNEVNWEHVRVLKDGETVSVSGTHLGHNLPDKNGARYCINLVSVAGRPVGKESGDVN